MVAQRNALLAWTGQTLSVTPRLNTRLGMAHWGQTQATGRGILALSGKGQIYQVTLRADEEYVAHPSNVLAYTVTAQPPAPYRLKSLRLQVPRPDLGRLIPNTRFFREITKSAVWTTLGNLLFNLRTWTRRTLWGDRLFLRFQGPATLLIQSRASRVSDVLTTREINEIMDAPTGEVQASATRKLKQEADDTIKAEEASKVKVTPTKISYATVGGDKKVSFGESKEA
jgi:hypothetical protein